MTNDPERSSPGPAAEASSTGENSNLSLSEAARIPVVPASEDANTARYQNTREVTVKEMSVLARQVAEIQAELARVETGLEGAKLIGPDRAKLRTQRAGLRDRLASLQEDQDAGQRRLAHLDQLLRLDAGEHAIATRRGGQEAGALVAAEMREAIHDLAQLLQRFKALQEEDRVAADIVRSVSPARLTEVNTFEFTTGVTQTFAAIIAQVIAESHRSEKDLAAREKARAATGATR